MNKGLMLAAFAVLLLGVAFAEVQGASVSPGTTGKYTATSAGTNMTEGGNVTEMNVSSSQSTEKWAAFYGNVTGSLLLQQGTTGSPVYTWSWTPSGGGEVCAAKDSTFTWTVSSFTALTKTLIDQLWAFPTTDTDSATSTAVLVDGAASYSIAGKTGTTVGFTDSQSWQTFGLADAGSPTKTDTAFCVNITTGKSIAVGGTGDYQLVVPTNMTTGTFEQYWFFVELD